MCGVGSGQHILVGFGGEPIEDFHTVAHVDQDSILLADLVCAVGYQDIRIS